MTQLVGFFLHPGQFFFLFWSEWHNSQFIPQGAIVVIMFAAF
ncbi:hypothetical protein HMPREF1981_00723 [Bacteroides pyogenes F0041]|uniref:Uncharacterized protein n=1 Tax=Bacteroides pyogenes F0041 TaxID=1321819 RepID=U2DZ39_9BACE|nr:hypothetical protein HMPREF1981_00723 [Bacteroides pyogenes F0041]